MSSDDLPDLPVAAKVHTVADGVLSENDLHSVLEDEKLVEEGDDLTPVSCAEEAIAEARKRERQRILEKIDEYEDKLADNSSGRLVKEEILEELRDDLQKQQEQEEVDA